MNIVYGNDLFPCCWAQSFLLLLASFKHTSTGGGGEIGSKMVHGVFQQQILAAGSVPLISIEIELE